MIKRLLCVVGAAAVFFGQVPLLHADQMGDMMSMLENMKQQMTQMQSTINQQSVKIQQLESKKVIETPQPAVAMAAPAQLSDADWQKGIKDNIGDVIPWLKGAKIGGDFRMRWESFDYDKIHDPMETGSLDRTQNRFRIRLRWGFEKQLTEEWTTGFRLATGDVTDVTSTNTTLTNNFAMKNILVDRAFAKYTPNSLKDYGMLKGLTVGVGKFENPFLRYSTTIMWDADVVPEGAYEQANIQWYSDEMNQVNSVLTAGQFITAEGTAQNADTEIYGAQGSLTWSTYMFNSDLPVDVTTAISYYDYPGYGYTTGNNTLAAPAGSFLNTNTYALDAPRVIDSYNELGFYVDRTPVALWYDWAHNCNDVSQRVLATNSVHDDVDAWGLGIKAGKIKKKGDIEGFYGYYVVGANAVVSAFNDSDFGGPSGKGFSNRRGHKFGLAYSLAKDVTLNWTAYMVEPNIVVPTSIAKWASDESVFRSQLDINYKF
ncbi:MAG: putative porin [Candidatus Omnitrophota bacterium]